MSEYDYEPIPGLPDTLPAGEELRWQGRPEWRALARNAFHVRKVTVYFGLILVWRMAEAAADGLRGAELFAAATWPVAFGVLAIGLLLLLAWLNARATCYTITNRRVVLRFGVALPIALNIPLRMIEAASLGRSDARAGSIPMKLVPGARISYMVAWPHVRPWHFSSPEPMLREVADPEAVARILAECWTQSPDTRAATTPATDDARDFGSQHVASAA